MLRHHVRTTVSVWSRRLLGAGAMLALWPIVLDAILVAPHALFITARNPSGEVYLINQSTTPEEVTVGLAYGFPATDSVGGVYIAFDSTPGPDDRAATPWLRAYPRRARVEPGQRQVVRILASPPADLPDGEYWSRLLVTSRSVGQPVSVATNDSSVHAGLTLQLRTITSVTFRKGAVHTGVTLTDFRANVSHDTLVSWVGLDRQGNAAFLGSVALTVTDANGHQVRTWSTPIAVYQPVERRLDVALDSLPAGSYTVGLRVSTDRDDIDRQYILPAEPIERTVGVEVH